MTDLSRPLVASYRLQLTPDFGFERVGELLGSIARLGVSHLYLSPIAEAVAGSSHGYDVVDHRVIRDEFGGSDGLATLLDAAVEHELGVIIDHVPNHVSVARADLNPHWWALLRDGPGSPAADWFDVDWELTGGKVIVPKLGEPVDDLIAAGALTVIGGDTGAELRYGPLRFPIAPGTEGLALPDLLAAQHYRLAWWRDPARNVRRFFTIDDLVAVRVENVRVRSIVDTLPRQLCEHPAFDGVRVDHVDGLADPLGYLESLRETIGDRWLLVEKILGPGETLPAGWPVDGTTGYEHITMTEHAMLSTSSQAPFDTFWQTVSGMSRDDATSDFDELEDTARREVLDDGLRPDLDRLLRAANAAAAADGPDESTLRNAVIELTVGLHRYRTYLPDDTKSEQILDDLVERTATRAPSHEPAIRWFADLVRTSDEVRTRWQQLTGPAMAKGAEDRAFYRHQRLSSLCEVGGRPGEWSISVDEFHRHQEDMQDGWPTNMLTDTTHDTKRSSGVRARSLAMALLSEATVETASDWMGANADVVDPLRPADVSLAIQTTLTAWPLDVDRLHAYLVKSTREADRDTNWFEPDEPYESALEALAHRLVTDGNDDSSALARHTAALRQPGAAVGLRLAALQLMCPGVPDLYQGAPMALHSLVDPDNRRPPDWERFAALLDGAEIDPEIDPDGDPDRARMALTVRLLALRRRHPEAFGRDAGYRPIVVDGPHASSVIAFTRTAGDRSHRADRVAVIAVRADIEPRSLADTIIDLGTTGWQRVLGVGDPLAVGTIAVSALVGYTGVEVLAMTSRAE